MKVISTEKVPIKMWLDDIENGALEQAKNLANLPFTFKHVAIMPDSHQGYGMPIGGVLATKGVVIPNAVGVDIGCGMSAVKTSITEVNIDQLKVIMSKIRQLIPVGFNKHKEKQELELMPPISEAFGNYNIVDREFGNAMHQLGTLGGGNHFIEIQKDTNKHIWIMVHSGSRNLGKQVADHYNKIAINLNERYFSSIPKEWGLAFLPMDTSEGQAYLAEMYYCIAFAFANRKLIMDRVMDCLREILPKFSVKDCFNIAHNYANLETHFGQFVYIHRKGATLAEEGTIGIIPGSQGSHSYIVKGRGNKDSFNSCSHGAGRKMGRKEAERTLNLNNEIEDLNRRGILHAIRNVNDLDEAPGAYKDISIVMENQKDLVDIVVELTPLAVIKG